jgi:hypothetical protein
MGLHRQAEVTANRTLHFAKESSAPYGLPGMLYESKGMYDKAMEAFQSL